MSGRAPKRSPEFSAWSHAVVVHYGKSLIASPVSISSEPVLPLEPNARKVMQGLEVDVRIVGLEVVRLNIAIT